ncbi:MAG TPA: glycine cleavage system aminomethyltransferase GcvT [Candidatus Marinimicrobia bacterium]|nr:glycine cleavage system aminomethyltransferase GcvT [Candidatus Neomarinimicrobiota bacterium]
MPIKNTSLYSRHLELQGKMIQFAGYMMPIQYTGIVNEHHAVRNTAGMFDLSHMGEFIVKGKNAESFLQFITINDVIRLKPGQAQYSAMCFEDGGIIDDLLIYCYGDRFMIVVNAANIQKDFDWLEKNLMDGVVLENVSDEINLIALQGQESRRILQKIIPSDLSTIPFYHFIEDKYEDSNILIARTGYTGELGFEIYGNLDVIPKIWDNLMDVGKEYGIVPVGLGARDTLRLEMKYLLYGYDIDESTNPFEVGLGWITKPEKGNFIGRKELIQKKEQISRRLVCFEMTERAIPRNGYPIFLRNKKVGEVTSGTQSPSLNKGIGLAFINHPHTRVGTTLEVEIRSQKKSAVIVQPPFYKSGTANI